MATSVSTTRDQCVINMAVPRGSVSRQYLQLYLGVFGFEIPKTPSGSIGTQSFMLTASYTVLPKLKKKRVLSQER